MATADTAYHFQCSTCGVSFADQTRCKQHCNQPSSHCNKGKAREDFARVIPVKFVFRTTDRNFGGSLVQHASEREQIPSQRLLDGHAPCEELDLETPSGKIYNVFVDIYKFIRYEIN